MATAAGKTGEVDRAGRLPVMPLVAYGVVLLLLGMAAVAVIVGGGDRGRPAAVSARSPAVASDGGSAAVRALKLPPRPVAVDPAPAERTDAAPAPAPSPAVAEPEKKLEPAKTACKVDLTRWPTDKIDQAQAVQMMLRDLGYYRGTTNGTVGPQTRTAIREFQAAAGDTETGEVAEALFEALKKKCAGPAN